MKKKLIVFVIAVTVVVGLLAYYQYPVLGKYCFYRSFCCRSHSRLDSQEME